MSGRVSAGRIEWDKHSDDARQDDNNNRPESKSIDLFIKRGRIHKIDPQIQH